MGIESIVGMLVMFIAFLLKDIFNNRATKKDLVIVQNNVDNANKMSEAAHRKASEAIKAQNEIKTNYLERFSDMKDTMTAQHDEVMKAVSSLSIDLNRNFVQKSECKFLHQTNS